MAEKRLLVLDGHSLAFRAFFSRDPESFRTSTGVYTNAVHGFCSMLLKMIRSEKPTHIGAAFDLSRHSFRTDIYPEYKGGRSDTPEEFIGQVENIQKLLTAMGIKWLTEPNVEADDILATLTAKGIKNGMEVLVSSGDRDTFQLISDNVTVLYPGRSIADTKRMTPQAVKDKYDVWPQQYPEIAALVGEHADNLPGVPLVGEKVAAAWINEYGSLDDLLEHRDELTGKRGENLRQHIEDVLRNRQLNRLRTDLQLRVGLEDLHWTGFDAEAVKAVCDELEFNQLRTQILKLGQTLGMTSANAVAPGGASSEIEEPEPQDADGFGVIPNPERVRLGKDLTSEQFAQWLKSTENDSLGIWAVGNIGVTNPRIDWLFLATDKTPQGQCVLIVPDELTPETERMLRDALMGNREKTVYDAKSLRHALRAHGWELHGAVTDVNMLDYLVNPDGNRTKFAGVTKRLLGWEIDEKPSDISKISEQMTLDLGMELDGESVAQPWPQTLINQGIYAYALLRMQPMLQQLARFRRVDGLLELENPLSLVLEKMEYTGIGIDTFCLDEFAQSLQSEVTMAEQSAFESIGREVNLSSPKQLQDVLFTQLELPKTKKTKTGYTTDARALEELARYNPHPFLEALLYHRDRIKLLQIVRNLRDRVGDDDRIHTTFGQTVAATGRLSSIDPNLQNIPARTADGQKIREAFVPQKPYTALMTADYSQIEMRIMAHLSGDEGLLAAFASGEDLHRSVAALVYGVTPDEVTSTQRSHVKATSYGLAYGLSAFGLAGQLNISQREAKELMDTYFERFGKVRDYLNSIVAAATKVGYTETMRGRRRYLPDLRSPNRNVADNARRAALNAPIQGSAADLMKEAMLQVDADLQREHLQSRVLLQVHDELVLEVAPGEEKSLETLVRQAMTGIAKLRVPLEVSVGIGPNWRAAAH